MQSPRPADELHEIRAEIAKLQAREAALVQAFLRDPVAGAMGRYAKAEIIEARELIFDAALLPDDLRLNPAFHREITRAAVQTQPLPTALSPRPGWPMRRETQAQALH